MTENGKELADIRVVGLHRVLFERSLMESDLARNWPGMQSESMEHQEQVLKQVEENWRNAWIVVVELNCPASAVDFGPFGHGSSTRPENRQAAWEEKILESSAQRTIGAFFLHYVCPQEPIWYGTRKLLFPAVTPAPGKLLLEMRYSSPD